MSCDNAKPLIPTTVQPDTLCSSELYDRFKDAVVAINAIPKFSFNAPYTTGGLGVSGIYNLSASGSSVNISELTGSPTGGVSIPALPVLPLAYSGFLYEKEGYIVSSSGFLYAWVLALFYNQLYYAAGGAYPAPTPAVAPVLIPIETVLTFIFDPNNPRSLSDFFDIFVTVFNVNGCGHAYVYRGYIVGVDVETGVALYRIDPCDPWNKCNEPLKRHIYLRLGNSKCYIPGSPVHVIGTQAQQSPLCMSSGTVVNNSNNLTSGVITYESIITDAVVMDGVEGAPILDQCGYVVGVVTGRTGNVLTTNQPAAINARLAGSVPNAVTTQVGTAFGVTSDSSVPSSTVSSKTTVAQAAARSSSMSIFSASLCIATLLSVCLYTYRTGAEIGLYGADTVYPVDIERWYDPAYCKINRELIGVTVRCRLWSTCGSL